MPADFDSLGIRFEYPDTWILDQEDALAGRKSVTVYSPGGAFWSISIHPHRADPLKLADAAVKAMLEEYEEVEIEKIEEAIGGRQLVGYDLNFYYLDLTNTATVRCLRTRRATYAVFCQAEDREFERVREVFLAITTSLLRNLGT